MKRILILTLMIALATVAANAAQNTYLSPILPMPSDTSARPDSFGYTWVDNDNGGSPVFNWVDITTIGVRVNGLQDDNVVGPVNLGFVFPYYWYTVNRLYIGSNGYISFSSNANYSQTFAIIPSATQPNDIVAPLAGDLDFTRTSSNPSCYYYTNNVDTFIISWLNIREWPVPNDPDSLTSHTFQMILCKRDSSITFQYGTQIGTFENSGTPGTHSCQTGIEDLVGRTGLNYMSNWAPADRVPHENLVVRFHPSPRPGFIFHDVGVKGGLNESSGGEFKPLSTMFTPRALIKNYGTANESNIQVNLNIKKGFVNYYNKTVTIPSIPAGEETWAVLPDTLLNTLDVYMAIFKTTLTGDQFAGNNRDTTEMRSYSLPMGIGYVSDTISQYFSWQGGHGGWANEFVMPEPVKITAIDPNLMMDGSAHAYLYILPADANGDPDINNILWGDTIILADTDWVHVPISPQINIPAGQKFFASVLAESTGVQQGVDQGTPLSNRGWEYTTSYATSRDRDAQDVAIRVTLDVWTGIDDANLLPSAFNLRQNYPNPFNARTQISFDLIKSGDVSLDVYNIVGQKIKTLVNGPMNSGSHQVLWDGSTDEGNNAASGVYFYKLHAEDRTQTMKMVLLK